MQFAAYVLSVLTLLAFLISFLQILNIGEYRNSDNTPSFFRQVFCTSITVAFPLCLIILNKNDNAILRLLPSVLNWTIILIILTTSFLISHVGILSVKRKRGMIQILLSWILILSLWTSCHIYIGEMDNENYIITDIVGKRVPELYDKVYFSFVNIFPSHVTGYKPNSLLSVAASMLQKINGMILAAMIVEHVSVMKVK